MQPITPSKWERAADAALYVWLIACAVVALVLYG